MRDGPADAAGVLAGGCLCGAVRYALDLVPDDVAYCHCRLCQRSSGAPVVAWATLPIERLRFVAGAPKAYASSPRGLRRFCGACGTQLSFERRDTPATIDVNVATLDDPARVRPRFHIWTASRIAWFDVADDLPRHADDGPDAEEPSPAPSEPSARTRAESPAVAMGDAAIRTLEPGEREAWLELLDGWELPDGWRGRDFFRRFLDFDPTFEDDNVWVAEHGGQLVACVQIFPRRLRVRGRAVAAGGIGSVFTRPAWRQSGIASALLERAAQAMRARGMAISLLFAARHAFYARAGWRLWPRRRPLLVRSAAREAPDPVRARAGSAFDAVRDLADAMALHSSYSAGLDGSVVRDEVLWRASLRLAGNPREEFCVARDAAGRLVAYVRGVVLQDLYMIAEWARAAEPTAIDALADVILGLQQPRDPDPLARPGRASSALRAMLVGPTAADVPLFDALVGRGVELRWFEERASMLRCLDPAALARAAGEAPRPGEDEGAWLARLLPPERFAFWPADRF